MISNVAKKLRAKCENMEREGHAYATEADVQSARDYYGPSAADDVVLMLAELLARIRTEAEARGREQGRCEAFTACDVADGSLRDGGG